MLDAHWLNITTISSYLADFGVDLEQIGLRVVELFTSSLSFVSGLLQELHLPAGVPWSGGLPTTAEFSEFQVDLLKTLTIFVVVNLLLILWFWRKYGEVISNKFIRPSTLKEIEELKLSVARLKLPKDYTPRI